ncbi:MAG: hypothetical protein GQ576_07760 [Methanococcoides sp.]|nr:hypothetical protein [Methanococcoides sp.]
MTLNTILCKYYSNQDNEVTLGSFLYNLVKHPYMIISPFAFPIVFGYSCYIATTVDPSYGGLLIAAKLILASTFFWIGACWQYFTYIEVRSYHRNGILK